MTVRFPGICRPVGRSQHGCHARAEATALTYWPRTTSATGLHGEKTISPALRLLPALDRIEPAFACLQ